MREQRDPLVPYVLTASHSHCLSLTGNVSARVQSRRVSFHPLPRDGGGLGRGQGFVSIGKLKLPRGLLARRDPIASQSQKGFYAELICPPFDKLEKPSYIFVQREIPGSRLKICRRQRGRQAAKDGVA